MSRKPRDIDLGPMFMPVGEDVMLNNWSSPINNPRAQEVARFESIMDRHRDHTEQFLNRAADDLASDLVAPDTIESEVERLWIGTGVSSLREVRIGLNRQVLPDTTVRLYEDQGVLQVELTVESLSLAQWLCSRVQVLAGGLGGRMGRPVEVSVFQTSSPTSLARSRWSHGEAS